MKGGFSGQGPSTQVHEEKDPLKLKQIIQYGLCDILSDESTIKNETIDEILQRSTVLSDVSHSCSPLPFFWGGGYIRNTFYFLKLIFLIHICVYD